MFSKLPGRNPLPVGKWSAATFGLARAMLRRPKLLVLDEATSAIDVEGEQAILERLLQATPRPTVVMIAHRSESLRHCQRILVFEAGRLVSDGSSSAGAEFHQAGAGA